MELLYRMSIQPRWSARGGSCYGVIDRIQSFFALRTRIYRHGMSAPSTASLRLVVACGRTAATTRVAHGNLSS